MLDSSGHFPVGLVDGGYGTLGDFQQCVEIGTGNDVEPPFVGQYCSPRFKLPLDFDGQYPPDTFLNRTIPVMLQLHNQILTNAFCIPSTCSPSDLKAILNESINNFVDLKQGCTRGGIDQPHLIYC